MSAPTDDTSPRYEKYLVAAGAPTIVGLVLQYVVAPNEAMWGTIELTGLGIGLASAFVLWIWRSARSGN